MQIQDFNRPSPAVQGSQATDAGPTGGAPADIMPEGGNLRDQAELTLLKKRIEHLELVIETARSLMTSNQERLLRRLHDLPQEITTLTAALHRLDGDGSPQAMCFEAQPQGHSQGKPRRVA